MLLEDEWLQMIKEGEEGLKSPKFDYIKKWTVFTLQENIRLRGGLP